MPASSIVRPHQVYDFTALSQREPNRQQPGDRLDAQFKNLIDAINALALAVEALARPLSTPTPLNDTVAGAVLGPNAGGFYGADVSGAVATASDYADVSREWAEHMPDTIPGNILAINAITGDHWSSRWWANYAGTLVAGYSPLPPSPAGRLFRQALTPTAVNVFPNLNSAADGTYFEMIINGAVYLPNLPPVYYTVSGVTVTWVSTRNSVAPTDEVFVSYSGP